MGAWDWFKRKAKSVGDTVGGAVKKVGHIGSYVAGKVGDAAHWVNTNPLAQGALNLAGSSGIPILSTGANFILKAAPKVEDVARKAQRIGEFTEKAGTALQAGDYKAVPSLYNEAKDIYNNSGRPYGLSKNQAIQAPQPKPVKTQPVIKPVVGSSPFG